MILQNVTGGHHIRYKVFLFIKIVDFCLLKQGRMSFKYVYLPQFNHCFYIENR